jgi:hypothetical protein
VNQVKSSESLNVTLTRRYHVEGFLTCSAKVIPQPIGKPRIPGKWGNLSKERSFSILREHRECYKCIPRQPLFIVFTMGTFISRTISGEIAGAKRSRNSIRISHTHKNLTKMCSAPLYGILGGMPCH